MSDDNTRPISVAELLARNGTIGSPPVGGHRRRKRRNAVSVAELTGEIPVIRTGEIPIVGEDEAADDGYVIREEAVSAETVVVYSTPPDAAALEYTDGPEYTDTPDYTPDYTSTSDYAYTPATIVEADVYAGAATVDETHSTYEVAVVDEPAVVAEAAEVVREVLVEDVAVSVPQPVARQPVAAPPRSSPPWARRRSTPERSHDPRPRRRSSDAEQMTYDPVDEAVDIADLVAEQVPDPEDLRSYLRSSTGTLFSGETVADDIARRGQVSETDEDRGYNDEDYEQADSSAAPNRGALHVVGSSVVAILQSLLAVVFGAGLFIAFDQLWQWNNIVALALSTLVIVALVVGVHVVRKTEDFVSILIAVAVGILVTFGPLALQSS